MKKTFFILMLMVSAAFADPTEQQIVQLKFDANRSVRLLNLLAKQNNESGNSFLRDHNNPQISGLIVRLNRYADTAAEWKRFDKSLADLQSDIEEAVRQPIKH
jgi:hypothetical protein